MKLIKNLDGVNKIWRKQYIIIINVLRITDCDESKRCKINLFLGTIHKSLLFICRWKGRHPEKVVYQVDKFTTVKGEAKNLKVKFRHYRFWSTWGCKNELWQILYYIIIMDGGSKYSIFSNIGNCHLFLMNYIGLPCNIRSGTWNEDLQSWFNLKNEWRNRKTMVEIYFQQLYF